MTVEQNDIENNDAETESQKAQREREEARDAELRELRKKSEEAELKAAKAEGEAEALRRGLTTHPSVPSQAAITEEQWIQMENESGLTRQQIQANAKLTSALIGNLTKPLAERAEAAEKAVAAAQEEVRKMKAGKSTEKLEKEFYEKNPGLSSHRGDIEEFLGMLPESSKEDPKQFSAALEKAKVYVRGKVREDLSARRTTRTSSPGTTERTELSDDNKTDREAPELDVSDLDNDGAKRLIENLHKNPGPDYLRNDSKPLRDLPIDEAYKKSERNDGRGVSIDESADWARGEKRSEQALRSGGVVDRR